MDIQEIRRSNLQQLADASSISEIARRAGRKPAQLGDTLRKRKSFGERLARSLEEKLGLPAGALDQPTGHLTVPDIELQQFRIPLVSWENAASLNIKAEEFLTSEINRPQGFALRVRDSSMAPSFQVGDLLVFEEESTPAPGKFVLASVNGNAIFRRYRQTGLTSFELIPENPDYPTIKSSDGEVKVVAVMVESRRYW